MRCSPNGLAITLLATCAIISTQSFGDEVFGDPAVPPPIAPAGISFAALDQLGDKADAELVSRFSDPKNERFREGLVLRMAFFGDLKHPNSQLQRVLASFIEHQAESCEGKVDTNRISTFASALEVIGERGGPYGFEYLKAWATKKSVYGRVRCSSENRTVEQTRFYLRSAALVGIAESGTPTSAEYLRNLLKGSSDKRFRDAVRTALFVNDKIREQGFEKYWTEARDANRARSPEDSGKN